MRIKGLFDSAVTSHDLERIKLHWLLVRHALDPRDRHTLVCASARALAFGLLLVVVSIVRVVVLLCWLDVLLFLEAELALRSTRDLKLRRVLARLLTLVEVI